MIWGFGQSELLTQSGTEQPQRFNISKIVPLKFCFRKVLGQRERLQLMWAWLQFQQVLLVYVCRPRDDPPVLIDSELEETRQREHFQKTYRLVRDNVLEYQKQQELNRKELMRCQLELYKNMQVSEKWKRERKVCFQLFSVYFCNSVFYASPFCLQATLWQRCKTLCDACKAFGSSSSSSSISRSSSSQVVAVKKEQKKEQAPEEAHDEDQYINNTNGTEAATEQPNKRAKTGAKTK